MSARITSVANLRNDNGPGVATQSVAILLAFIFASTDHNRGNSNAPDLGQKWAPPLRRRIGKGAPTSLPL
jgi:hypothetical protein